MDPMLQVALATFLTYGALYAVILPALASVLPGAAAYAKCSPAEQSEWNTRIISTLHAVVVTAGVIPPLLPGRRVRSSRLLPSRVRHARPTRRCARRIRERHA